MPARRSILWTRASGLWRRLRPSPSRTKLRPAEPVEHDSVAGQLPFDATIEVDKGDSEPAFLVDVDGFEGPLDLLLELARRQKVDLQKISILALAEQYLAFIEAGRRLRLELAADYLVMAAWLAYLKSRLLLPAPPADDEPSAADLATDFARRLQRLEAIRAAARHLGERPQLGRDFFGRGAPEPIAVSAAPTWEATLYDLLSAYARQRSRQARAHVTLRRRIVWSLAEARAVLERLVGRAADWSTMEDYLAAYLQPDIRRTVMASTLSAALEMAREGRIEIRQDGAFAAIWLRPRPGGPPAAAPPMRGR
jgi:segregation and condensation protein A